MQVLIAEHSGFCEGVERAFRIAIDTAKAGRPVYMLGNLVHNKLVVDRLKNFGVKSVAALEEIPAAGGVLLISAHGVAPEIYAKAKTLKLEVVDTTCPWVKKAQKIAKQLADEGRTVVIVGDKGHPEVKGLVGWSGGRGLVVERIEDIENLELPAESRVGVLAQTTQPEEHFNDMAAKIRAAVKDLKEYDTICDATTRRQSSATELARKTNLMLVVGDRLSANTKRLAELCLQTGTETHQIENAKELDPNWLKGRENIGLTAGASTPDWVIQEVIEKLKTL